MTITATRARDLLAEIAAERLNDQMTANVKPAASGYGTAAYTAGQAYAETTLTWAGLRDWAEMSNAEVLALVGTEVAPSTTYSTEAEVHAFRLGVLTVFNALYAFTR